MRNVVIVLIVLLFTGCGYTPSAKHSRAVVGEKISTSIIISMVDPENTVIIKDGVDAAIIEVFHATLVSKAESTTHLTLQLSNPFYTPVQYDVDGFIVSYRTTINLRIVRSTEGQDSKSYNARGTYDFSITPNAIISDKQRFDAIKFSGTKAIKSFIAQVSAEGARAKKNMNIQKDIKIEEEIVEVPSLASSSSGVKKILYPKTSIRSRLDNLEEIYKMKIDGLLSDEEFKTMKNDILTR